MSRITTTPLGRLSRVFFTLFVISLCVLAKGGGSVPRVDAATCGNGTIETGEACDDGNLTSNDGCSATCTVEQSCYDVGNSFSFFLWSDSYTSAGDSGVESVFSDAVDRIKYPTRVIPRFWVSTGDIPFMAESNTKLDSINSIISGNLYPFTCSPSNRQFPYFVAIGNHDIDGYGVLTEQQQYTYWRDYVGPKLETTLVGLKNFRQGPQSPDGHDRFTTYSFDYKNAHFVVVNQYYQDPNYPTPNPVACIRPDLYNWIATDLAQTTKPLKFVFGHEPAWSYCSVLPGYGGSFCPVGNLDNQNPANRARPYSTQGSWLEPFGGHWGDSLELGACPTIAGQPGRDAFWSLLANHGVVAHFNGHTHTYSSRLVQGNGSPRNDVSAYSKTGQQFNTAEGVWGVETGITHNSAGAVYVLVTVQDNVVTFEAYDKIGSTQEPFRKVESWNVVVGTPPPPNTPPVLTAIGAQTSNEQTLLNFTATATDADSGQTLTYSLVSPPSGASINATTGVFSWTPTEAQGPGAGPYTVTVKVTDNGTPPASAQQNVLITVNEVNQPPVLAAIGNKSAFVGVPLTFTASTTDPDLPANTLSYNLLNAPGGASIDQTSGVFSWTPTAVETVTFSVVVTDNGNPALHPSQSVTVTVTEAPVNRAPVLAAIGPQTVNEQTLLNFTATATESDIGQTLTYSLVNVPSGASINATTGAFSWTPTEAQGPGSYQVTVQVTDNGVPVLSAQQVVDITVNEVNQAPSLNAISNKTVTLPNTLTFTAIATDSDLPANTLTYSLANAPSGASINANTGVFSWTPTAAGTVTFSVVVTDSGTPALSASRSVTVTVKNATNTAPVLAAIAPQTVNEQTLLNFTATATDVDSGQTLTYSLVSPPSGANINSNTGVFSWTPGENRGPAVYNVTVRVRDNGTPVLSHERVVVITVNEVNRAPNLNSISNKTVTRLNTLTFTATATDPDVPDNSLTYSLVNAPSGATMNATTGGFSWTPTVTGVFNFTVRVTDNGTPALSHQRNVKVTVR